MVNDGGWIKINHDQSITTPYLRVPDAPRCRAVEDHPLVGLLRSDGSKASRTQAAVTTQGVLEKSG